MDVDSVELPKAAARLGGLAQELGAADAVKTFKRNYAGLRKLLDAEGLARGADAILADLGVSSMQLDDPSRGFSWKHDAPLDLRMNPERGIPAGALLAKLKKEEIEDLLRRYGDEPEAAGIASYIAEAARRTVATHTLLSTSDISQAVESAYKGRTSRDASEAKKSSLQRTFQAIRILVNDELTALDAFLRDLPHCLAPGGRAAILTFHSGEDRRVKTAFKAGLAAGLYTRVADEVIRATPEERGRNPRSSSAKLRWAARAR
jgi:16S rRNA (cytosine1402-N4)-methyltransferase